MDTTQGSIEILFDNGARSEGIVITTPDPGRLPEGLEITRALHGFQAVEPPRRTVDLEWTAMTHDGFDVAVLWRAFRLEGPQP